MPDIFTLQALFQINGSLINRSPGHRELSSGGQKGISLPDAVHLHSQRNGVYVPVASGTSLAGALLSRSIRIANTLGKDGYALANEIFGHRRLDKKDRTKPTASRLWVEETVIQNPLALVQSRIKIDRFTGGVYPGALFHEQPVFGKGDTLLEVNLRLENPKDYEIGLLLLLLKDWTGDLPWAAKAVWDAVVCVEKAVLRGSEEWIINQAADGTVQVIGDVDRLEQFVQSFGR